MAFVFDRESFRRGTFVCELVVVVGMGLNVAALVVLVMLMKLVVWMAVDVRRRSHHSHFQLQRLEGIEEYFKLGFERII